MKIIKEGKKPEDKAISFNCYNCGCIFECVVSETKVTNMYNKRERRTFTTYEYDCPTCDKPCNGIIKQ
jgi:hypothetical protein